MMRYYMIVILIALGCGLAAYAGGSGGGGVKSSGSPTGQPR